MEILREIIYEQNKELLERIANDKYIEQEDKENFMKKYHKKNFSCFKVNKREIIDKQIKKLIHCVK